MSESENKEGFKDAHEGEKRGSKKLLQVYDEFREYVRTVALEPEPEIPRSDPEVHEHLCQLKIEFEDYRHALVACQKIRKILSHHFVSDLIEAGSSWKAEFGTDENRILSDETATCIRNFFISTGSKLLVKKRGSLGIVYYFGWYETKPLIMRTVSLLEYSMTSEGYLIANPPYEEAREAIKDFIDIQ